jgi:hypothetical protein
MPKVDMPRASWDAVLIHLDMLIFQGYMLKSEYNDIKNQVDSQEN